MSLTPMDILVINSSTGTYNGTLKTNLLLQVDIRDEDALDAVFASTRCSTIYISNQCTYVHSLLV